MWFGDEPDGINFGRTITLDVLKLINTLKNDPLVEKNHNIRCIEIRR